MRGSHPISRARRRGQALLLAVLIMIFAALISAAFIGVVATNLNQTARQSDKDRAVVAAQAGLDYVKKQLAFSAEGDRWRTELANVPPAPGDASYGSYYTPLEITQGWARTTPHPTTDLNGNGKVYDGSDPNTIDPGDEAIALANARALAVQNKTGKLELIKSPDPRVSQGDPIFLSQVERIPYNLVSNHPDFEHAGSLKITVIGLSSDDPTAWQRRIAYKGGYQDSPLAQTMRTVSNWDFNTRNGFVAFANPTGTTNNGQTSTSLAIKNAQGDFSQLGLPFTITISNPRSGIAARSAVVTAVGGTYPNFTLTLAQVLPTGQGAAVDERVELAANLGAPTGIDYDNNSTTAATALSPTLAFRVSDGTVSTTTNQVDSARVNGGLVWSGQLLAEKLRAFQTSFGGTTTPPTPLIAPGSIQASSVIALESTATPSTVAIKDTDNTIADTLQASSTGGIFSGGETANKYQLISDGWKRLQGGPTSNSGLRAVSNFIPPDIAQGEGLERYRNLARSSNPAVATDPATASYYGYGQGIYIDNSQDKEKIYDTAKAVRREMTQSELVTMWLSKNTPTPADFTRTGIPTLNTDTNYANVSLEQLHLRGWVGPDEFRARGVSIELKDNAPAAPTLIVTRDARDDAPTARFGQDPGNVKAWKDRATGAPIPGVYQQELPWPTNGVIFAEGNIRIRGAVTGAPTSLTVVSMNNIYIEGSLDVASHRILLLGKRNVVMNPTRVLGRPDSQTAITAAADIVVTKGTATNLTVANGLAFKQGDFIQTLPAGGTPTSQGYVSGPPTVNSLPYTPIATGVTTTATVATTDIVQTPLSSLVTTAGPNRNVVFNTVNFNTTTGFTDSAQRHISLPPTTSIGSVPPANLRLAFNHEADRVAALKLGIEVVPPTGTDPPYVLPDHVYFSNKGLFISPAPGTAPYLDSNASVVPQASKRIRAEYSQPTPPTPPGQDDFPGTPPAAETDLTTAPYLLTGISAAMNSTQHVDSTPGGVGWRYKTSIVNAAYGNLPFTALAGFGNRYDFDPTNPAASLDRRQDLVTTTYDVPLATSIGLFLNGSPATIFSDRWDTAASNYEQTQHFGFTPAFLDPATPLNKEDLLTGDQGFYQTDILKSTLDSRSLYDTITNASSLIAGADNALILRQGDVPAQPSGPAKYPDYRLFGAKLENIALTEATPISVNSIDPGYTFNINAYVYAQTGSWFIIPTPLFDERLRGTDAEGANLVHTYLDLNNNNTADPGEYTKGAGNSGATWEFGDYVDLNRNGTLDETEKHAMARYSRFNYQINFTGAIAENQTALVNDIGNIASSGAVASWMDKMATSTYNGTNVTYDRIKYYFDPSVAIGDLENEPGFYLPQTPDLNYVS